MRITALSGGVGGARFLRGLREYLRNSIEPELRTAEITIIGNTGDDITLFGLRICPDLDTLLYTLGGGIHEGQGWGRADESFTIQEELAHYRAEPQWLTLGDRDFSTHILRTELLAQGQSLSEVTARLSQRWGLPEQGIELLPMTDSPVETYVELRTPGEQSALHFQEWWVRYQAKLPAQGFHARGIESCTPAPGVLHALHQADLIILPPSNPIVSIGIILAVPELREALIHSTAPIVGVSPIVAGRPVRGHADACLAALGIATSALAVSSLYADFLTGWLVAPGEATLNSGVAAWPDGLQVRECPLLMTDGPTTEALAARTVEFARELIPSRG